MRILIAILIVSVFSLFAEFTIPSAFAYLDPASGTLILQMLAGVLVGVVLTLKVFWFKIKLRLSSNFKKDNNDDEK